MKIIIVGNGKVGYAIACEMAKENHDIVMVDSAAAALHRADTTLDIMCVEGNGASISVLIEAGARQADLVVAVTDKDETNLVCCLIAKKLGARHTIARVRNPEYRRDANTLKQEIGLDMVINPDLSAAREIARILSFPTAFSVEPFARGRIDMIGFQVADTDALVGRSLSSMGVPRIANVLICAAEHSGELLIPDGSFVPAAGDKLYIVGTKPELLKLLQSIGRTRQRIKTVSVLGGSRTAVYLAWELARIGMKVRIVEISREKCVHLAAQLPQAMIIEGDGTDSNLIDGENIFQTDAFVSLTDRDEENLLMAINAQRKGVGKVIAKMTRPNYMDMVQDMGIDTIISPKDITAGQINRYVRALANSEGSGVESLYRMLDGTVEALEFTAAAGGAVLDTPLKDLRLRRGVLIAAIARGNEIIIPGGMTCLRAGDHVVVVSRAAGLNTLDDILAQSAV
ncbi:MAG: Trk system potassium transporter TrkA [Oscillospiraceae bacterium]|nr:Trk system potassium transporter TrkA [Oscillospiraceae bacterium]